MDMEKRNHSPRSWFRWSAGGCVGLAISSVREFLLPRHAPAPFTLIVLIVAIVIKEILFRYVVRVGRNAESTAIQTDAWHHRTDAMTSVAAFIGISVALIGGDAWQSADDWAALFACAVIAANGFRFSLRRSTKSWTPRRRKNCQVHPRCRQLRPWRCRGGEMLCSQDGLGLLRRSTRRRERQTFPCTKAMRLHTG